MSFDTLAPVYRAMEFALAGPLLQRARTHFLPQTRQCRRALLLGEGPGRLLVELLRDNPSLEITCLEQSPRMIAQALHNVRRRGLDLSRVQVQLCNVLDWQPPPPRFDLIGSCFFLDCFCAPQLAAIAARVALAATSDAQWLLTDFNLPSGGWQRWRAQSILRLMYGFFRLATNLPADRLAAPDPHLRQAGFQLVQQRLANFGLIRSDLWQRTGTQPVI